MVTQRRNNPESTEALVERVRRKARLAEDWDDVAAALTELAERLAAAERERDEAAFLLIDTTRSTHDLAARVKVLEEALTSIKHELGHVTQTPAEAATEALKIARAALSQVRET